MKVPFIIFLSFLFTVSIAQQNVALDWSNEFRFERDQENLTFLGIQGDKLYTLGISGSNPQNSLEVQLLVYDVKTLSLLNEMDIADSKSDFNFERVVITKDQVLVFTSYYDRQLGFKILSVEKYNERTNRLSEMVRVDEVFSAGKNETSSFKISVSPDGDYILLFHKNRASSGDYVMNMKMINRDFEMLWEKEITLNYKERMFDLQDLIIDNYGSVYFLASLNPYGIKANSGFSALINLKSALFTYRPYEDKLKEFEFALSKNWINSVKINLDEYQNVIATAYYTNPNDYKVRGFVVFELNGQSGSAVMRKMVTLDKDLYKLMERSLFDLKEYSKMLVSTPGIYPGTSSHMNHTSTEFKVNDVFLSPTGNVMTIEVLRHDELCTESFNQQQMIVNCEKHYLYGDVILVFFDRAWSVKGIERVRKIQHSLENPSTYYSFSAIHNDKNFYIMYNDDVNNFKSDSENDLRKIPLTNASKGRLRIEGFNFVGKPLNLKMNTEELEFIGFEPGVREKLNDSEFLLYSRKEKNYKFGRLLIQ